MVDVGSNAPDFHLKDQEGNTRSLSEFKGRWVVLYFYPKDNTPGCTKEACDFTALKPDFTRLDAIVIGVSPDKVESHQKFVERHDLDLILLSDPDKDVLRAYGAWGEKKNYGRVYEGVIRSTFIIGPDQKVRAVWRNVKVRQKRRGEEVRHADLVKKRLEELKSE